MLAAAASADLRNDYSKSLKHPSASLQRSISNTHEREASIPATWNSEAPAPPDARAQPASAQTRSSSQGRQAGPRKLLADGPHASASDSMRHAMSRGMSRMLSSLPEGQEDTEDCVTSPMRPKPSKVSFSEAAQPSAALAPELRAGSATLSVPAMSVSLWLPEPSQGDPVAPLGLPDARPPERKAATPPITASESPEIAAQMAAGPARTAFLGPGAQALCNVVGAAVHQHRRSSRRSGSGGLDSSAAPHQGIADSSAHRWPSGAAAASAADAGTTAQQGALLAQPRSFGQLMRNADSQQNSGRHAARGRQGAGHWAKVAAAVGQSAPGQQLSLLRRSGLPPPSTTRNLTWCDSDSTRRLLNSASGSAVLIPFAHLCNCSALARVPMCHTCGNEDMSPPVDDLTSSGHVLFDDHYTPDWHKQLCTLHFDELWMRSSRMVQAQ